MTLQRFDGDRGRALLVDEIGGQARVVGVLGSRSRREKGNLVEIGTDQTLIEQSDDDNDVGFIVSGQFAVLVNSKRAAYAKRRRPAR